MKRIFTYFMTSIVFLSYIIALTGFGIHECADSGSRDIVALYGDVSCEKIHHHSQGNETHHDCACGHCDSQESDHNKGCCSTKIVVLDEQQDVINTATALIAAGDMIDLHLSCLPYTFAAELSKNPSTLSLADKPPLPAQDVLLSYISQWRL